jgi:hypothetical protein
MKNNGNGNFFENVGNIANAMMEFGKRVSKIVEPVRERLSDLSEITGKFFLEIIKQGEISDQFNIILLELGYPPMRVLDIESKKMIIELYSDNHKNIINYIDENVLKNLSQEYFMNLLIDWRDNALLKERIQIMEELINLHNNKKYFGSTILALSQIEGIIADGFYHSGYLRETTVKNYVSNIQGNGSNDEAFQQFINDIVLVHFEHGKEIGSNLSRHAIMHGADKTYGNYSNSIKAILLLDYLQDRFNFFYIEDSKILHQYGCRYLNKTNKKIIGTRKVHELVRENYKLCKICMKD